MAKTTMGSHAGEPNYDMHGKDSGCGSGMDAQMAHVGKDEHPGGEEAVQSYKGNKK